MSKILNALNLAYQCLLAEWKRVLSIILIIATLWIFQKPLYEGWKILRPLKDSSADALFGCFLIFAAMLIGAKILLKGGRFLSRGPLALDLHIAINSLLDRFRNHIRSAIGASKPIHFSMRKRWHWNALVADVLQGTCDPEILQNYCESGWLDRPLIFGNFQSYAYAVAKVLERLPSTPCDRPFPKVWTVFSRPLHDWYNTFPVEWSENEHLVEGKITFKWWEQYKQNVANLRGRDKFKIQFHRVVASFNHGDNSDALDGYYLYETEPLSIKKAVGVAKGLHGNVEWHPSLINLLSVQDYHEKDNTLVYLIGKPLPGSTKPPESQKLVNHFHTSYHDRGEPALLDGGVYVKYAHTRDAIPSRLFSYNDLFIVQFNDSEGFGLAFIKDDTRDISGTRILPQQELRSRADGANSPPFSLCELIEKAWRASKPEWNTTGGSAPDTPRQ